MLAQSTGLPSIMPVSSQLLAVKEKVKKQIVAADPIRRKTILLLLSARRLRKAKTSVSMVQNNNYWRTNSSPFKVANPSSPLENQPITLDLKMQGGNRPSPPLRVKRTMLAQGEVAISEIQGRRPFHASAASEVPSTLAFFESASGVPSAGSSALRLALPLVAC